MKILVLGGTRFCGLRLVETLRALGEEVTVSSRRVSPHSNVRQITGERDELLPGVLSRDWFDTVYDFTAYNAKDVRVALTHLKCDRYFFISSLWVNKLDLLPRTQIPNRTKLYVEDKLSAEKALSSFKDNGMILAALRLPILLGEGDHTKRSYFYSNRLRDDRGIIVVDEGKNIVPLANVRDVATNLALLKNFSLSGQKIQNEGMQVIDFRALEKLTFLQFLEGIRVSIGSKSQFYHASAESLQLQYPQYLEYEPFWRETELPMTGVHISSLVQDRSHSFSTWVKEITTEMDSDRSEEYTQLRTAELRFIQQRAV